jgi:hypothetical protein
VQTDNNPTYPASNAYRVIWRWTAKPTWHDRGFFNTRDEAQAHVAKIVGKGDVVVEVIPYVRGAK